MCIKSESKGKMKSEPEIEMDESDSDAEIDYYDRSTDKQTFFKHIFKIQNLNLMIIIKKYILIFDKF